MKSIEYTITHNGLKFSDAIVLEDDVVLTDAEIEQIKQTRFNNWYTVITTPVEYIPEEIIVEEVTVTEEVTAEEVV